MPDHSHPEGIEKVTSAGLTLDRRNSDRFPFSAMAEITELSSRAKVRVRVADIGHHGCYTDSMNVFPIGTRVQLRIRHEGAIFDIPAKVTYSLAGMGMGLNFSPMSPETEATLKRWLAEANGESLAPHESLERHELPDSVVQEVLIRLIKLMMRKGLLSDSECKNLLEEMSYR